MAVRHGQLVAGVCYCILCAVLAFQLAVCLFYFLDCVGQRFAVLIVWLFSKAYFDLIRSCSGDAPCYCIAVFIGNCSLAAAFRCLVQCECDACRSLAVLVRCVVPDLLRLDLC